MRLIKFKLALVLFILLGSCSKTKESEILHLSESVHFEYHNNGELKSVGQLINNKKKGVWRYFNEYSELRSENYNEGKFNGEYKEYRCGRLLWVENFISGKRNG